MCCLIVYSVFLFVYLCKKAVPLQRKLQKTYDYVHNTESGNNGFAAVGTDICCGKRENAGSGKPNQWGNNYPSTELMTKDIQLGCNYLVLDNGDIVGTFVMLTAPDPSYKQIDGAWLNNEPYATIHRLASLDGYHGIFAAVLDYVSSRYDNVRADTHQDNLRMQHLLLKHGFRYCGNIVLSGRLPKELQPVQEDIQADNPLFRLAYQLSK